MNRSSFDGNILGRLIALALMAGAVYGARAILRSEPAGVPACCALESSPAPAVQADGEEEEAKLDAKAPVSPPR